MAIDPERLARLAEDRSAFARGRLLQLLSREILIERRSGDGELAIFYDIVRVVLPAVGLADRRIFCETAVDQHHLPRDLLLDLAHDHITVAEPMLIAGHALTDPDLVDIATRREEDHRFAIAARATISAVVSDALVETGSRRVLHRLCTNRGADFSDHGLRRMQLHAEDDRELFEILVGREDLSHLLGRALRDTLEPVAEIAAPRLVAIDTPEPMPQPPRRRPPPENPGVAEMVERVRAGRLELRDAVARLADADRHADLASFLGAIATIDESQVLRVLVRADANGIATVLRGLSVDAATYEKVVEMRRRRLKFSAGQARFEREHYGRIDPVQARATIEVHGARRARA